MAVSKKRKVANKPKKIALNNLIRMYNRDLVIGCVRNLNSPEISNEDIQNIIDSIKSRYLDLVKNEFDDLLKDEYFILTVGLFEEITYIRNNSLEKMKLLVSQMKEKTITKLNELNAGADYYISMLHVSEQICPQVSNELSNIKLRYVHQGLSDLILYLSTFTVKFENKYPTAVIEDKDGIRFEYGEENMFTEKELETLEKCIHFQVNIGSPKEKSKLDLIMRFLKVQNKLWEFYNKRFVNATGEEIISDKILYIDSFKDNFPIIGRYNKDELNKMISRLPDNRLFATPAGGIRFDVLNKNQNIDYVDMVETKDYINLEVNIINNGNIYESIIDENACSGLIEHYEELGEDHSDVREITKNIKGKKRIEDNLVKLRFSVDKYKYRNYYNKSKEGFSVELIGHECSNNKTSREFMTRVAVIVMCCLYMAYYDPTAFSDDMRIGNRVGHKKGNYNKDEYYRVAHLRKLPTGYECSPEAKRKAELEGFDVIPEGYTFVESSNIHLAKTKKINIK